MVVPYFMLSSKFCKLRDQRNRAKLAWIIRRCKARLATLPPPEVMIFGRGKNS